MRTEYPHRRIVLVLAMVALAGAGCRSLWAPPPELERVYMLQRYEEYWTIMLDATVPEVKHAVVQGLKDLGLEPLTSRFDQVSGTVHSIFADQDFLEIVVQSVDPGKTRFQIRCGLLGEKERSRLVFRSIAAHLPGESHDPGQLPDVKMSYPYLPH